MDLLSYKETWIEYSNAFRIQGEHDGNIAVTPHLITHGSTPIHGWR